MEIFLNNFNYLSFNSLLALVAVIFGWLMLKPYVKLVRIFCGFVWFVFLPNTIYILTDITHLFEDWSKVNILFKFILIIQYSLFSIFGIISFVLSVYFLQKILEGKSANWKIEKMKPTTFIAIFILNFMAGFAVIMGGIQRTNSWHILTNPSKVIEDVLNVIYSGEMLLLAGGIGILANIIYFLVLKSLVTWGKKYLK